MKKEVLILLALGIFFINFSAAIEPTQVIRQGSEASLTFTCYDDISRNICDTSFLCNATINYPNTTLLVNNAPATRINNQYNISLPDTHTLGFYKYNYVCTNGTNSGVSTDQYFLINAYGEVFDNSKATLYLGIFFISLVFFLLSLYASIKIPWKDTRTDDGSLAHINNLKYLKLFMWFFTYLFLIMMTFMVKSIAQLLENGVATNMFNVLFWILLVSFFPTLALTFGFGLIKFFKDQKINKLLMRNIRVR